MTYFFFEITQNTVFGCSIWILNTKLMNKLLSKNKWQGDLGHIWSVKYKNTTYQNKENKGKLGNTYPKMPNITRNNKKKGRMLPRI